MIMVMFFFIFLPSFFVNGNIKVLLQSICIIPMLLASEAYVLLKTMQVPYWTSVENNNLQSTQIN